MLRDFDQLDPHLQDALADWPAHRAAPHAPKEAAMPQNPTTTIDWNLLCAELSRPFPDALIKYRVGAISRDKTRAQALAYVAVNHYIDRLNELIPGRWQVAYEPWGDNRLICRLTIGELTRSSTGDGTGSPDAVAGAAMEAQALKRACARFGLGRYLYELPVVWIPYDPEAKTFRTSPAAAQPQEGRPLGPTSSAPKGPAPLGRQRASTMHRELARLGLRRSEHQAIAQRVLERPVDDFATLTEGEAKQVWRAARLLAKRASAA